MALISIEQLQLDSRLAASICNWSRVVLGVIGPNGAGKSSLLECIAGLQPYTGRIELEGKNLKQVQGLKRAQRIALLPQRCQSAWALKVADVIALGRLLGDENADIIAQAAQHTGVSEWLDSVLTISPAVSRRGSGWRECWRANPILSLPTNPGESGSALSATCTGAVASARTGPAQCYPVDS